MNCPGNYSRAARLARLVRFAMLALLAVPALAAPERIVAVGDVHGSPVEFSRILEVAEIIDEAGNWIGGSTVLVQTGDLTDRGPGVRAVLDLMRALEGRAAEGGGRLVSLLGNHEAYNLIGFLDYQSTPVEVFAQIAGDFATETSEKTRKKAYRAWNLWANRYPGCKTMTREEWMIRHPLGLVEYHEALSPRGEYGRWLRERAVVAKVGDTLFTHGGLSPALAERGLTTLDQINELAARELAQFDTDREWLEKEGLALPFSTLGEIYCAFAHELQPLPEGTSESKKAAERRQRLQVVRDRLPASERWFLLDANGPSWFRGYAKWTDEEAAPLLESIFRTFGGRRVVVGHTPKMGEIVERFDGQVFLIDTAMAYPEAMGKPVALEIRGDDVVAIYESGRVPLAGGEVVLEANKPNEANEANEAPMPQSASASAIVAAEAGPDPAAAVAETQQWLGLDGEPLPFKGDAAILDFLRTAEVIDSKFLGKGVTRPKKLLLERDGIRTHAVFHNIEKTRERHRLANGELLMFFRDSYKNNVAAYELSRMLGMDNVPPVVLRRVSREEGSVQFFIERAIDETERKAAGADKGLPLTIRRRVSDMWVFDNLINNIDRNAGNMLFDSQDGFWLIDHTRAFARSANLYSPEKIKKCSRRLLEAIRLLDEEATIERLDPYLTVFEIRAMFKRREKLLDLIDAKIAEEGEAAVLFDYGDPDDQVRISYD